MTAEVTVILILAAAALIVLSLRKKYRTGIERINAQAERKVAEIIAAERNDSQRMQEMFMQQIESSQSKIEHLQKELDMLKEAGEEKTHAADGAVRHQLQRTETGKQGKATSKKTKKKEE